MLGVFTYPKDTVSSSIVQERKQFTYLPIPETRVQPIKTKVKDGWCTSFVASKRKITWHGNAGTWAFKAAEQGYEVSTTPKIGAIYVTSKENSRSCPKCGHVAIVKDIQGDKVQLEEMNYVAYGVISTRWLSTAELLNKEAKFIY